MEHLGEFGLAEGVDKVVNHIVDSMLSSGVSSFISLPLPLLTLPVLVLGGLRLGGPFFVVRLRHLGMTLHSTNNLGYVTLLI